MKWRSLTECNRKGYTFRIKLQRCGWKNWREKICIQNRSEEHLCEDIQLKVKFDRPSRTEGIISTQLRHRFGDRSSRRGPEEVSNISAIFEEKGGDPIEWINLRGGSATICLIWIEGKISGAVCVCVTAEELKTASKINSRPLIQNTYSTCDTFAV